MRRYAAVVAVLGSIVLAGCVTFGSPAPLQASADQSARSGKVAFAHISSGGDVLALTTGGPNGDTLELLAHCGDGCLERIQTVNLPDGGGDLAVADFNHDGVDDAVVSGHTGVHVYLGHAATPGHAAGLDRTGFVVISAFPGPQVITGDFDGDGNPDVGAWGPHDVQIYTRPAYVVAKGNGTGGFAAPTTVASFQLPKVAAPAALGVGDINGDGRPEALASIVDGLNSRLLIFAYSDTGLVAQFELELNTPFFIATGDFDGDGRADVAMVEFPPNGNGRVVRIYRSTGTSLTDFGTAPTILTTPSQDIGGIAVHDLDGDGNADVIVTDTDAGTISWWNGMGNGQFRSLNGTSRLHVPAGSSPTALALGDVGGTALPDAVVANSDQPYAQLSVLTNTSSTSS